MKTTLRRSRVGTTLMLAAVAALLVAACGSGTTPSDASAAPDEQVTIAFVPGSTTAQFYLTMKEGAQAEADRLGAKLIFQGATEFSPAAQTPIINALAAQDIDALVVAPTDQESMFAPINALYEAGVKIVAVDTTLKDKSILAASVSASNQQGGAIAADQLVKALGTKGGSVAILGLNPGATTINERAQGFTDQVAKSYPNLTVLPTEYVSGTDPSDAQTKTEALLLGHTDLVGIFAPNQPASEGAAAALKAQGKTGVVIIGYDSSESQVALLESGAISALVLQQPALEGQLAVQAAYAAVTGGEFKKEQLLDNILATTENAKDPAITKFYY